MRILSKSKLLSYRQCPRRLWLEVNQPELSQRSSSAEAAINAGFQVGDVARKLYDPSGAGALIDIQEGGFDAAFEKTQILLRGNTPIFEAGFRAAGALAFADVMLPAADSDSPGWHMVEVKSSTSLKDYYLDDVSIQAYVARKTGVPLRSVSVAHVDNTWVYPGGGDYRGLLIEHDLTALTLSRTDEVSDWITAANGVLKLDNQPVATTGRHCSAPYECGFYAHCQGQEPQAVHPIFWLPRLQSKKAQEFVRQNNVIEMAAIPDELLNAQQLRVKTASLSGTVYFDVDGASQALRRYGLPAYFMDFETIQFAVPIWKGTRPYQIIPFQFSVQLLSTSGELKETSFLDLSGNDPSRNFAEALISACGTQGPVFVYNAGFETTRVRELAQRFSDLSEALLAIIARVVDLLPVAQNHYYHPSQQGSWSIKKVLPAAVPELSYDKLDGVQDGGMAMDAFIEAIQPETSTERKQMVEKQLLSYCGLDTYAMVRLWQVFTGYIDDLSVGNS